MKKFLTIIEETGYFRASILNGQLNNLTQLPLGNKLLRNINHQWINSFSHNNVFVSRLESTVETKIPDFKSYLQESQLKLTFDFAENRLQLSSPFNIFDQFKADKSSSLVCTHFFSKTSAQEIFQRLQRERKLWWMKHFSNPTNQTLSEINTNDSVLSITIQQKSNFIPKLPLEVIELCTDVPHSSKLAALRFSTILEDTAIGLLEDAIDLNQFDSLDLHRKITPIQICFFYTTDTKDENQTDLLQLGRLLELKIRKSGISCLNSDKFTVTNGTKIIYETADKLGITYGIQLDDESLRSGLIKLRNRKTKLFETIHVSDVPDYLVKIFQSVN